MSGPTIRRLREVGLADAGEVGGKAASQGDLLAAGFRVPDGFVLGAASADLSAVERAAAVRSATAELGGGPFAVRSSGIAEDGTDRSWAGMYESILDVQADEVPAAVERVLDSAHAARVAAYEGGLASPASHTAPGGGAHGGLAVLVQRMIRPVAAGVALTADPVSGDRYACVVTAVAGVGERLVSGAALGDEWLVRRGSAVARRTPEKAIDRRAAVRVASEAARIGTARGRPQDVEWAIDAKGTVWIVQARPMTALPPDVSWEPPGPGAYTRALRFGEWIAEPVTPLFESWLLTTMEERLHERLGAWIGQHAPRPHHVVVNGWYFYSLNWLSGSSLARSLPGIVRQLVRAPRRVAGVIPPTVRFSVPVFEREWREDLLPRYRAAVAAAEGEVETLQVEGLPALIDGLADLCGEYFASLAALSGAAYKMEINLARFYRRHLAPSLGGSHLSLLAGFAPPEEQGRHAVATLDWWFPAPGSVSAEGGASDARADARADAAADHQRLVAERHAAEEACFDVLASSPRRLRSFRTLLAETQHLVPLREEQVGEFTLPWPVMRRAVVRIGGRLAARGAIGGADDVFFLARGEAIDALAGGSLAGTVDTAARRATRDEQARLVPPLRIGRLNPMLRRVWDAFPRMVGAVRSDSALVSGSPASPGRASGPVRVIRGAHEFEALLPGEVLVAPLTAPAWTPLFARAAAVVTDVGSAASHASIIAREFGIPAVVGCGDATARLRTGMLVTVDGTTGNVEPA